MSVRRKSRALAVLRRRVVPVLALVVAPFMVVAGVAAPAYAFAPSPPSPVAVTSTVLQDLGQSAQDVETDVEAGGTLGFVYGGIATVAGADAFTATAVVGVGLDTGYTIGYGAVKAYNWVFGSTHVVNHDVVGGTDWQPTNLVWQNGNSSSSYSVKMSEVTDQATVVNGSQNVGNFNFTMAEQFNGPSTVSLQVNGLCLMSDGSFTLTQGGSFNLGYSDGVRTVGPWQYSCAAPAEPDGVQVQALSAGVPVGAVLRNLVGYSPPPANPERVLITTGTCVGSGGSTYVETAQSAQFTEQDSAFPDTPAVSCTGGDMLQSLTVVEHTLDGSAPDETLIGWTAPASLKSLFSAMPVCGQGVCQLRLERYDSASQTWTSCFDVGTQCAYWANDANQSTDYRCTYGQPGGSFTVEPISECSIYVPTFDPETKTALGAGTITTPYSAPGSSTSTDPNPSGGAAPAPSSGDCPPPLNWGLSLVSPWWYYHVGQCVLEWAFVPPPGSIANDAATIRDAWDLSPPGVVVGAVGGIVAPVLHMADNPGDCHGPDLKVSSFLPGAAGDGPMEFHPFDACGQAASMISGYWMPVANVITYLGGFLVGLRILVQTIGLGIPMDADPNCDPT